MKPKLRSNKKPSCANYCDKTFKKDFMKRYKNYSRKVIKNKNLPIKIDPRPPSDELLQKMNVLCLGNYCNPDCKGFDYIQDNFSALYKKENTINDFHKNISKKNIKKLKKKGIETTCVDPEEFYNVLLPEVKPQKSPWSSFSEKYIKK